MAGDVSRPLPENYASRAGILAWRSMTRLVREPSHSRRAEAKRAMARRWLALTGILAAAIMVLMFTFDVTAIVAMPPRGTASLWPLRILTEFGKASYILWTLFALMMLFLALLPRARGSGAGMLIGCGTRIQFMFFAVLMPMLAGEVIKGVVGRARPFVGGHADAFNYSHFAWTQAYASFPSGHAIAAFALAFAVSAIWPGLRGVMWTYALIIALTRIALLAHHPSDVVGGALVGIVGAMAVRYWFAARRLVFTIRSDGTIEPLAGPTFHHLKGVARRAPAP